jgi:hypothetical protein
MATELNMYRELKDGDKITVTTHHNKKISGTFERMISTHYLG